MDRRSFLLSGVGGLLSSFIGSSFAKPILDAKIDKLVDSKGNFVLQPLPYSYEYLEPVMDAETVYLHYKFHHGGAVKGANKDFEMIKKALEQKNLSEVDYWTKRFEYHFSSHVLHTIFWTNLTKKQTAPKGELLKRIEKQFGTVDKLKALLSKISKSVMGNGWGILAYQIYTDSLVVLQCENHERLTQWGAVPLLVIDVWEHSYYLKYKNNRGKFVDNVLNIINWDDVARRLDAVASL